MKGNIVIAFLLVLTMMGGVFAANQNAKDDNTMTGNPDAGSVLDAVNEQNQEQEQKPVPVAISVKKVVTASGIMSELSAADVMKVHSGGQSTCVAIVQEKRPNLEKSRVENMCEFLTKHRVKTEWVEQKIEHIDAGDVRRVRKLVEKQPEAEVLIKKLNDEQAEKFVKLSRAQQEKLAEKSVDEIVKYVDSVKLETAESAPQPVRAIAKQKLEQAKERYMAAKQRYVELKNAYSVGKQEFQTYKAMESQCENGELSADECADVEQKAIEAAKEYLSSLAQMVDNRIVKMLARIDSSENIDESQASEHAEELKALQTQLQDAVSALESAETKAQVKQEGSTIISVAKKIEARTKWTSAKITNAEIMGLLKRADLLEKKLEAILSNMEEQGLEIDEMDSLVDDFSSYIEEARQKYVDARALIDEGESKQAHALMKESHELIKKAYDVLKEITRLVKNQGGSITMAQGKAYVIAQQTADSSVSS